MNGVAGFRFGEISSPGFSCLAAISRIHLIVCQVVLLWQKCHLIRPYHNILRSAKLSIFMKFRFLSLYNVSMRALFKVLTATLIRSLINAICLVKWGCWLSNLKKSFHEPSALKCVILWTILQATIVLTLLQFRLIRGAPNCKCNSSVAHLVRVRNAFYLRATLCNSFEVPWVKSSIQCDFCMKSFYRGWRFLPWMTF